MNSLYEDLTSVREYMHIINEYNIHNKFLEAMSERTDTYVEYIYPTVESYSLIDKDISFLENLELVLDKSNKIFLETYRSLAEETNPIGLVADKLKEKSLDNSSLDYLQCQIRSALQSNDIDTVDDTIEKLAGVNACFDKPLGDLMCCGKNDIMESVFEIEENKRLTREDVVESIKVIESCKDKIKDLKDKAKDKSNDHKMKISNLKKDMEQSAKDTFKGKPEDKRKPASECCMVASYLKMEDMINRANIVAMESQILEQLKNSRSIVAMTAHHNPRNIRESVDWANSVRDYTNISFDNFIESCIDLNVSEFLDEQALNEAFEDIRSKMVLNNKKFLRKYQDAALKSNCEGIVMKKYYVPVTGLENKMNKIIKDVENMCKKAINTNDVDQLKSNLKKFRGSLLLSYMNGEATEKSAEMIGGNSIALVKDLAVKEQINHKVTKQDVKFAVDYLKNVDRRIDEAEREFNKILGSIYFGSSTNSRTIGRDKDERIIKQIIRHEKEIIENIQLNYRKIVLKQLKIMQTQCRKVIMLAARTKATESDIKEAEDMNSLLEQLFNI